MDAVSRFIVIKGLLDHGCLVGRKRIFIMGSPGYNVAPAHNLDDVSFERNPYSMSLAHDTTIACNEALVYELSKHYPDAHVFGLNPGWIKSADSQQSGGSYSVFSSSVASFWDFFSTTPDVYVARAALPLALTADLDSTTNKMFNEKGKEIPTRGWVANENNRAKVWNESAKLVAAIEARVAAAKQG